MFINTNEQTILNEFAAQFPDLHYLHSSFLDYASVKLDTMPIQRFGQLDVESTFSPEEFAEIYGIDTSHRLHPIKQRWTLQKLLTIDSPNISGQRSEDLFLAAVVHDMGKSFCTASDPTIHEKQTKEETTARHEVLQAIAGPSYAAEIIDRTDPILLDEEHPDFNIFELSEWMGDFTTAGVAARVFMHPHDNTRYDLAPRGRTAAGMIATRIWLQSENSLQTRRASSKAVDLLLGVEAGAIRTTANLLKTGQPETYQRVCDSVY